MVISFVRTDHVVFVSAGLVIASFVIFGLVPAGRFRGHHLDLHLADAGVATGAGKHRLAEVDAKHARAACARLVIQGRKRDKLGEGVLTTRVRRRNIWLRSID
eukprot:5462384-Pleurochrysis_carterae.AAC.1